jgi:hypothetical protein
MYTYMNTFATCHEACQFHVFIFDGFSFVLLNLK